ncbi:UNVERIFIED_CONTAM: hypothetical protein RF653_04265 [Kocuria sp. CPCC 205316]|uniref:hypothetical protein n=1 Tax=Kocuria TaxID=57493 RepID=UPI0036D7BB59
MSFWGRLALVAAGGVLGAAATRFARSPGQDLSVPGAPGAARTPRAGDWRSRLYRFAATVRAGMDEREAELRESFGVATPRPPAPRLAARDAVPPVLDGTAAPRADGTAADPTDPSTDREGKHR